MVRVAVTRDADRILERAGSGAQEARELASGVPWALMSGDLRAVAETALTERQLEAFRLQAAGLDLTGIGERMSVSKQAARKLIGKAHDRIREAAPQGVNGPHSSRRISDRIRP